MKKLKTLPILVGISVDTLGSIAVGIIYFIGLFGWQIARGTAASEVELSTTQLIVTQVVGLILTAIGGLVAARMARTEHLAHGAAVGLGALFVWLIVAWISPSDTIPAWYEMVSFAGIVPAGALGGYLAGRRANKPLQPTAARGR